MGNTLLQTKLKKMACGKQTLNFGSVPSRIPWVKMGHEGQKLKRGLPIGIVAIVSVDSSIHLRPSQ